MKKATAVRFGAALCLALIFSAGIASWMLWAQTSPAGLITDIASAPDKYWDKSVTIKGHVRSLTVNPPGSHRGSYVLRDANDADITIITSNLPAPGKDYTVSGIVEQAGPDSMVPVIRESRRSLAVKPADPSKLAEKKSATGKSAQKSKPSASAETTQPAPTAKEEPIPSTQTPPVEEAPRVSTNVIIALIGAAALIVILIIIFALRPKKQAQAPAPAQHAATSRPPAAASIPTAVRPTVHQPVASAATQVVPPAAKATEVFLDLGMELSVTDGPDRGKHFSLTKPIMTIGRSGARQNDITLGDGTVSREHARILYLTAEKAYRLVNESKTNPVRVNDSPIEVIILKEGDSIQMGSTLLKFVKRV